MIKIVLLLLLVAAFLVFYMYRQNKSTVQVKSRSLEGMEVLEAQSTSENVDGDLQLHVKIADEETVAPEELEIIDNSSGNIVLVTDLMLSENQSMCEGDSTPHGHMAFRKYETAWFSLPGVEISEGFSTVLGDKYSVNVIYYMNDARYSSHSDIKGMCFQMIDSIFSTEPLDEEVETVFPNVQVDEL